LEGRNSLGLVFLQAGNFGAAEKDFRVLRLKPGYAEAHYNLGLTLRLDNKEEESRA
jgi:lipoprotein NlpI